MDEQCGGLPVPGSRRLLRVVLAKGKEESGEAKGDWSNGSSSRAPGKSGATSPQFGSKTKQSTSCHGNQKLMRKRNVRLKKLSNEKLGKQPSSFPSANHHHQQLPLVGGIPFCPFSMPRSYPIAILVTQLPTPWLKLAVFWSVHNRQNREEGRGKGIMVFSRLG